MRRAVLKRSGHRDGRAGAAQPFEQRFEPGTTHGRVRLTLRDEERIDANVELHWSTTKPRTAATGKFGRLGNLFHSQDAAVECARLRLAAGRHRKLHVIEREKRLHRSPSRRLLLLRRRSARLVLGADGLLRSLARAGVRLCPLAAHGQAAAMTLTAIAAD